MKHYYELIPGTESHKKYKDHLSFCNSERERTCNIAIKVGAEKDQWVQSNGGKVVGFYFNQQPVGWKKVGKVNNGYYPKKLKVNSALIEEIDSIQLGSPESVAITLFGKCPLYFKGFHLYQGAASEKIGNRLFIHFIDDEHLKLFIDLIPDDIVPVRESEVIRAQESLREQNPKTGKKITQKISEKETPITDASISTIL